MLHQYPQIPGIGSFLPKSLPRETAWRRRDAITPVEQEAFFLALGSPVLAGMAVYFALRAFG